MSQTKILKTTTLNNVIRSEVAHDEYKLDKNKDVNRLAVKLLSLN